MLNMSKPVYIMLTQGKQAIVDAEDFELVRKYRWYFHPTGYAYHSIALGKYSNGKKRIKTIKMHRLVINTPAGKCTDHINGDKLDNRRSNLRVCDSMRNQQNRATHYNQEFKGISWNKRNEKWQAYIRVNKKLIHLGTFSNKKTAASKYNQAALEHFGEFARLNNV